MTTLLISFERQNLRLDGRWVFSTRRRMRFEWLALLAIKRIRNRPDEAWVTVAETCKLPAWTGKQKDDAEINIGRYLQAFDRGRLPMVDERARWSGPYRLAFPAHSIEFDVPIVEAERRLRISRPNASIERKELLRFTVSYVRAQWLVFRGRLVARGRVKGQDNAYSRLLSMAGDRKYGTKLRLIASLGSIDVLFRLGRFQAALQTLARSARLVNAVDDPLLKARYHLAFAWSYSRGSSTPESDEGTLGALRAASAYAEEGGDRATLGLLAHRTSMYLTKMGRNEESIAHLVQALQSYLLAEDYDAVQACCGDLGSIVHRLEGEYYEEARCWLLAGIAIARWMKIGLDNAHTETILGKIYTEQGRSNLARFWLRRAEKIAEGAGNPVSLGDVKMVVALWHQRFGNRDDEIDAVRQALQMFAALRRFDRKQKESYMARKFPEVWQEVTNTASDDEIRGEGRIAIHGQLERDVAINAQGESGGRRRNA